MGTKINGVDCSNKTLQKVQDCMQEIVESYTLSIRADGLEDEQILATDFDVKFTDITAIEEAMEQQNPFAWSKAMFEDTNITAKVKFSYSQEKLDKVISNLS